ncbi:MAG: helix-turn-helix domain-containing protein, partial [Actinomycetales bacterium]|nr:helix-turn-helix domain-containing protein [Actinomycetales bacterium]
MRRKGTLSRRGVRSASSRATRTSSQVAPAQAVRRWDSGGVGGAGSDGGGVDPERLKHLVRLRRVRDRIDREFAQPLDVESLARNAQMSAGHFSRRFRAAYGESPYGYVMTRRIERAMALLRRGD